MKTLHTGTACAVGALFSLLSVAPSTAQVCDPENAACLDTTAVPDTTAPGEPVFGWADLHAHQFSNLGFGGALFSGSPVGPVASAMNLCTAEHGVGGVTDVIGNNIRGQPALGFAGHRVGGHDEYQGWPRWDSVNHQAMHVDWLHRAFLGGQKLVVIHTVNNEVLCIARGTRDGFECDDDWNVRNQIAAIRATEYWIDLSDDFEINGSGWYRVVYGAAEARAVIEAGKMAVVIGVEVDSPFNCDETAGCSASDVRRGLKTYHDLGVRHLFPIHVFDNAFGGAAVYNSFFVQGNKVVNGKFVTLRTCTEEEQIDRIGFTVENSNPIQEAAREALLGFGYDLHIPDEELPPGPHCNAKGLTDLGRTLIEEMIRLGMIIDTDHMSNLMFDEVLEIAEASDYPLVASHTTPLTAFRSGQGAEGSRNFEQLQRMRDLDGMMAVNLAAKTRAQLQDFPEPPDFTCDRSSQGWAEAYSSAVGAMSHENGEDQLESVALGSDFNGFIFMPAPRLGRGEPYDIEPCGNTSPDSNAARVSYPFAAHGKPGQFSQQRTGERTYDIHQDGLAHVGMLPDFVEELKVLGMSSADLEPLFRSAEKYLRLWAKAEAFVDRPPIEVSTDRDPQQGWYADEVTVTLAILPAQPYDRIHVSVDGGTPFVGLPPLDVHVDDPGETILEFWAVDSGSGETSESETLRIAVDADDPILESIELGAPDYEDWYIDEIGITPVAQDATSGIATIVASYESDVFIDAFGRYERIAEVVQSGQTATLPLVPFFESHRTEVEITVDARDRAGHSTTDTFVVKFAFDGDGDGVPDPVEVDEGSDPEDPDSFPEVCDGADNDGDGEVDEGTADADGDGDPDCTDPDRDGDGVDDVDEELAGSDPSDPGSVPDFDFGDAPEEETSFPVSLSRNGARHAPSSRYFGASVDSEANGQPGAIADGDGADEDGVTFLTPLHPGLDATIGIELSGGLFVSAWFDWNGNGSWDDAGETVIDTQGFASGSHEITIAVPGDAVAEQAIFARFRGTFNGTSADGGVGSDGKILPGGFLPDGEVEDYAVTVAGSVALDFGDAPGGGPFQYPVRLVDDGARHRLGALRLGTEADGETDAFSSPVADGDDANGVDDEDGVAFRSAFTWGGDVTVDLEVTGEAYGAAWIDFDRDGVWEDDGVENVIPSGTELELGINSFQIQVPSASFPDPVRVFARFRVWSRDEIATSVTPAGQLLSGEVEDYAIPIGDPLDYGDAPEDDDCRYPVTLACDGARHGDAPGRLGPTRDTEGDGLPSANASGDGADDDGVTFLTPLVRGQTARFETDFQGTRSRSIGAWIDFDQDGTWEESEDILSTLIGCFDVSGGLSCSNEALSSECQPGGCANGAVQRWAFLVPADAVTGATHARFRVGGSPEAFSPTGLASSGEVEDYAVQILDPTPTPIPTSTPIPTATPTSTPTTTPTNTPTPTSTPTATPMPTNTPTATPTNTPPPTPTPVGGIGKGLESGPDADGDGEIDEVVETGLATPTAYEFLIAYGSDEPRDVIVVDVVPAAWEVTSIAGNTLDGAGYDGPDGRGGTVEVIRDAGNPTVIEWQPDPASQSVGLRVGVDSRPVEGSNPATYLPASCGRLVLNQGSLVFDIGADDEPTGEPTHESNRLCLAALEDLDPAYPRDGSGDRDGDGVDDLAEACELETPSDPCTPTCDGKPATIIGTEGADFLDGTHGDDVILGLGGDDDIDARGGEDTVCGGDGDDHIRGGPGPDLLLGGDGDDDVDGGLGIDECDGGEGSNSVACEIGGCTLLKLLFGLC